MKNNINISYGNGLKPSNKDLRSSIKYMSKASVPIINICCKIAHINPSYYFVVYSGDNILPRYRLNKAGIQLLKYAVKAHDISHLVYTNLMESHHIKVSPYNITWAIPFNDNRIFGNKLVGISYPIKVYNQRFGVGNILQLNNFAEMINNAKYAKVLLNL